MTHNTPQEDFWVGDFGDQYSQRNVGEAWIASNTRLFARILGSTRGVGTVLELGANIGLNLQAIRGLLPRAKLSAVEINASAVERLAEWSQGTVQIYAQSIHDFSIDRPRDFVFTKGVLIHLNPETLPSVYDLMYSASARYLCVAEYYNPTPVGVSYRGNQDRLFKRDFAGELLDRFPGLTLVDYGFQYHRDNYFPQDDLTWFLLSK